MGQASRIVKDEKYTSEYLKSCLITKKTIVVIAYRMNITGLLELNAEAPIFVQHNERVADTSIDVAPVALPRAVFVVR